MKDSDPSDLICPGPRAELLRRYAQLLADVAQRRGFIGPSELDRLWPRHIANCAALAPLLPTHSIIADVGSGAGLPGLVIAIIRPDVSVTCIDSIAKRCLFLREVIDELALSRAQVVNARSENVHHQRFDYVTARAVAPMPVLIRHTAHLLKPNGHLLALKGSSAEQEIEAVLVDKALSASGACRLQVAKDIYDQPVNVVVYQRHAH